MSEVEQSIATNFGNWIETHFAEESALKVLKLEALERFSKLGLPTRKSEAYKYTPVTNVLNRNFDFSIPGAEARWDKTECRKQFYPIAGGNHLVFVNGLFSEDFSLIKSPSDQLTIQCIDRESYSTHAPIKKTLGKTPGMEHDAFAMLNLAMFDRGLFLHAQKNTDNLPVFIYHFLDTTEQQDMAYPRVLVQAETGSRLDVYEKAFSKGSHNTLGISIFESSIGENAEVRYTKLQDYAGHHFVIDGTYAHQHPSSRFYTNTFSFKGALIRNNIYIAVDGENCEAHMHGLYLVGGRTHVDNNTAVDHLKPRSHSNELYKGIVDENARAVFNGKIYVRPDAQKTNAFQANNNILRSDTATVNTKPQLEIWADDVQCSHGCTTGQLDDEAIFYLRSRGINKKSAQALMLNAFAKEALPEVKNELVREELENLILDKLGQ